jgi:hypothetical protein
MSFKSGMSAGTARALFTLKANSLIKPTLSGLPTAATEGTGISYTIDDYNVNLTYELKCSWGDALTHTAGSGSATLPTTPNANVRHFVSVRCLIDGITGEWNFYHILVYETGVSENALLYENAGLSNFIDQLEGSFIAPNVDFGSFSNILPKVTTKRIRLSVETSNTVLSFNNALLEGQEVSFVTSSSVHNITLASLTEYGTVSSSNPLDETVSSLVAKYQFENNLDDTLGNHNAIGYNESTVIDFPFSRICKHGSYSALWNSNIHLEVPTLHNETVKTVSMWVYPTSRADDNCLFSSGKVSIGTSMKALFISTDGYLRRKTTSIEYDELTITDVIPLNEWTHIIRSGEKIYINGVLKETSTGSDNDTVYDYPFYIGANGGYDYGYISSETYGKPFDGMIDQVEVFDRALTDAEALTLYNQVQRFEMDISSLNLQNAPLIAIENTQIFTKTENDTDYTEHNISSIAEDGTENALITYESRADNATNIQNKIITDNFDDISKVIVELN